MFWEYSLALYSFKTYFGVVLSLLYTFVCALCLIS